MNKKGTAAAETINIMIRIPRSLHSKMMRRKEQTGVSIQWQVLNLIKASHEADGKAART